MVPEIRVCPEMLRVFWYIDVLTYMHDLQLHSARMTRATRVFCEDY